jgi:hypothetical protein
MSGLDDMTDEDRKGKRRVVGFALMGSAAFMLVIAALVYAGALPMSEYSRPLLSTVLSIVAVVDLVMAAYFLVSDPS